MIEVDSEDAESFDEDQNKKAVENVEIEKQEVK